MIIAAYLGRSFESNEIAFFLAIFAHVFFGPFEDQQAFELFVLQESRTLGKEKKTNKQFTFVAWT